MLTRWLILLSPRLWPLAWTGRSQITKVDVDPLYWIELNWIELKWIQHRIVWAVLHPSQLTRCGISKNSEDTRVRFTTYFRCEIFFSYRSVPLYPFVVGYLKLSVVWIPSSGSPPRLNWTGLGQEPLETWKRLEEFWWRLHVEEGKALKGSRKIQQLIQNPSVIQEN